MKQYPPLCLSTELHSLLLNRPCPTPRWNNPRINHDFKQQCASLGCGIKPGTHRALTITWAWFCVLRWRVGTCTRHPHMQVFGANPAPALCKQLPGQSKSEVNPFGKHNSIHPLLGSRPDAAAPAPASTADIRAEFLMKNITCKLSLGLQIDSNQTARLPKPPPSPVQPERHPALCHGARKEKPHCWLWQPPAEPAVCSAAGVDTRLLISSASVGAVLWASSGV